MNETKNVKPIVEWGRAELNAEIELYKNAGIEMPEDLRGVGVTNEAKRAFIMQLRTEKGEPVVGADGVVTIGPLTSVGGEPVPPPEQPIASQKPVETVPSNNVLKEYKGKTVMSVGAHRLIGGRLFLDVITSDNVCYTIPVAEYEALLK